MQFFYLLSLLAQLVFCQHALKSPLLGCSPCNPDWDWVFPISLNAGVITSARGNSLPEVQTCEATEVIALPSKVTHQIVETLSSQQRLSSLYEGTSLS